MTVKEQVLKILEENKGRSVSEEDMAKELFVSRNAVWKAIKALQSEGHIINAVTNRGYSLSEKSVVFSPQSVMKLLGSDSGKFDIIYRETVGSTNTELKALAEKGSPEGTVLIAGEQTAGKGRRDRSFSSPKGTGLYMSILLRPDFSAEKALFITTCAAVAVAEAVDEITGGEAEIKWVNDVYLNDKKVCGILTEASVDFEGGGLNYAICGIGVNFREEALPEELRDIAGGIGGDPKTEKPRLAAEILRRFFRYYEQLETLAFLPEYRRRSLLTGKTVSFTRDGKQYKALVLGIDELARLMVRLENGEELALSSGEVTIEKSSYINGAGKEQKK